MPEIRKFEIARTDYSQCKIHAEEICKYICLSPDCKEDKVICSDCCLTLHKKHDVQHITEFLKQFNQEFSLLENYENTQKNDKEFYKKIEKYEKTFDEQCTLLKLNFENYTQNIKSQIQKFISNKKALFHQPDLQKQSDYMDYFCNIKDENRSDFTKNLESIIAYSKKIPNKSKLEEKMVHVSKEMEIIFERFTRLTNNYTRDLDSLNAKLLIDLDQNMISHSKRIHYTNECNILKGHKSMIFSVDYSKNGQNLLTGDSGKQLTIYNSNENNVFRQEKNVQNHSEFIYNVQHFNNDPRKLISVSKDGKIKIWDFANEIFNCLKAIDAQSKSIQSCSISQDDKILLIGCENNLVKVFDLQNDVWLKQLLNHKNKIQQVLFSKSNKSFISVSDDYTINHYNGQTYELKNSISSIHNIGYKTQVCSYENNEQLIAVAGPGQSITLITADSFKVYKTITNAHYNQVTSVLFSKGGNQLFSGDAKGIVKLWDLTTLELEQELKGHTDQITAMCLNPEQDKLVTASLDTTVRVWKLEAFYQEEQEEDQGQKQEKPKEQQQQQQQEKPIEQQKQQESLQLNNQK